MAVKKSKPVAAETPKAAAPTKAPATKKKAEAPAPSPEPTPVAAASKAPAPKAKKAASPAVASDTASKAETPKPALAPKKAPAAATAKKVAAPVKLTDRQLEFLKQIHGAKDSGYLLEKKAEHKTIEALINRKLIKKGAKDKASGHFRYMVSKAGEKHLSTLPPA